MALTKTKKQEILGTIESATKDAKTIVFVKFDKLNVFDAIALRRALRAEGAGYRVAKKTLLKRALEKLQTEGTLPELPGEIAFAWSADLLAPARAVYEFAKTHKEQVEIVGGIFDGVYKTKEEMMSIATIPGMDSLRGMFANVINSPLQRFAVVLSEYAKTKTA